MREDDEQRATDERQRENRRHQDTHVEHVLDFAGLEGGLTIGKSGLLQLDHACAFRHNGVQTG